ncbi:hypothetical protein P4C99_21925 [Pontiellaceae bacterium B1224]|nr:hypothetical protein [Pontiellaceae bacterium B1224]
MSDDCSGAAGNGCYYGQYFNKDKSIPGFVWTPDSGIGAAQPGEDGYPVMNGGYTKVADPDNITYEEQAIGFATLVQNNWEATKRAAEAAAEDCKCDCKDVWAVLRVQGDFASTKKFRELMSTGGISIGKTFEKYPCKKNAANN